MLDKQARKALAEHCVYCRRMDRMNVPLLGTLTKMIFGKPLKFPKMHVGHVKYGDQPQSLTVDKWWYKGADLYEAYDTTQVFDQAYPLGSYSMLPPWYQFSGSFVNWNWRKAVQLSKIYLRQYSRTILLAAGVFAGGAIAHAFGPDKAPEPETVETAEVAEAGRLVGSEATAQGATPSVPLVHRLRVARMVDHGNGRRLTFADGDIEYTQAAVEAIGVSVARVGNCRYRLTQQDTTALVDCF